MAIDIYDVFLSFKGEVRPTVASSLRQELEDQGFRAFMDEKDIDIGDEIPERIKEAIKYSRSAIIVFSVNYPSSKACLTELVHILGRNNTSNYIVVPIYYHVKPTHVKHQLGEFGNAFNRVKERNTDAEIKEWKSALVQVGNIFAITIAEDNPPTETDIIKNTVAFLKKKFIEKYPEVVLNSDSNRIPQQNQAQIMPKTRSHRSDIEEATLVASENNVNPNTSRDRDMACGAWLKDWTTNNLKFIIVVLMVSAVIISSIIFTLKEFKLISSWNI